MKKKMNKKGFTLIELIVVVAVLAIIAAVAIPVASDLVNTAEKNADDANVALYQSAIERYVADGNSYPATVNDARKVIKDLTHTTKIASPKQSGNNFYYVNATGSEYKIGQVYVGTTTTGAIKLDE